MPELRKAHARGTSIRCWLPMRCLTGKRDGHNRYGRPSPTDRTRHRRPAHHSTAVELRCAARAERSGTAGSLELAFADGPDRHATVRSRSNATFLVVLSAGDE